jgi:hypothetical protein
VTPRHRLSPAKTVFYGSAVSGVFLLTGCTQDITNNACFDSPVLITADGKAVDMGGTVTFETSLNPPHCYPGIEGSAGRASGE